jgi:hypothetical protein
MLAKPAPGLAEFVGDGEDAVVAYMLEEADEEVEVD